MPSITTFLTPKYISQQLKKNTTMKIFQYSTLISTINALSKRHDSHLDVLFVTQISSKCLFTMWTISSTHFSGVLNNIWMFCFVMQFQTQVIEKYTGTLVTHKFLFIFETRWDSSVNVFVMLNKIHCCIKFLIKLKVIYQGVLSTKPSEDRKFVYLFALQLGTVYKDAKWFKIAVFEPNWTIWQDV